MKRFWHDGLHWLCGWLYYERITVLHRERLPGGGPTLYIVLHRNGAVDGFVYQHVVPHVVSLISTQLLRSALARFFFCGIAVARGKDGDDDSQNAAALDQCRDLLASGGALMIFPEGTSSLGPHHLPFKSGAASIAVAALAQGIPLRIAPLGIHYEEAWAFRSKVEVVVGEAVDTALSPDLGTFGRLKEMKRRMNAALEGVGANFPSEAAQAEAQRLAYAATLGTSRSYFDSLKFFERGVPEMLKESWRELEPQLETHRVRQHQRVPLFPIGPWAVYALLLAVIAPVVVAGALLNLPPLLAGWLAARRFADGRNVIALWRILVGLPVLLIWFVTMLALAGYSGGWWWAVGYAGVTFAALKLCYRVRKLSIAVWNGLASRDLRGAALAFHQRVLHSISLT
jgi:1-acyl-sn-glycerol-3-phosphate acyltransferase